MKFNEYFQSITILETERLMLRAFCYEDMQSYFDIIFNPQVKRYMGGGLRQFREEPHISNWLNNVNHRLLKTKTVFT